MIYHLPCVSTVPKRIAFSEIPVVSIFANIGQKSIRREYRMELTQKHKNHYVYEYGTIRIEYFKDGRLWRAKVYGLDKFTGKPYEMKSLAGSRSSQDKIRACIENNATIRNMIRNEESRKKNNARYANYW
jgi:hypothetical protein